MGSNDYARVPPRSMTWHQFRDQLDPRFGLLGVQYIHHLRRPPARPPTLESGATLAHWHRIVSRRVGLRMEHSGRVNGTPLGRSPKRLARIKKEPARPGELLLRRLIRSLLAVHN